jgi:DnaK suppressor protein
LDELSEAQLGELESVLESLKQDLTRLLADTSEAADPVDLDEPIGRLSRMDAMQQQQMQAANRQAATRKRQQVSAALGRLAAGEYGDCQSCGEPIGYPRLSASPEAPFCLDCQSRRENRD